MTRPHTMRVMPSPHRTWNGKQLDEMSGLWPQTKTLRYIETIGLDRTELITMIRTKEDQALTSQATKASSLMVSSLFSVSEIFFVSLPCQCNSKQDIWEKIGI